MSNTAQPGTLRTRLKSDRRSKLLAAAERLIAERGYHAVRLEDIGAVAGVSGPAIYRHFPSKEAMLVELLVGVSARLLDGARTIVAEAADHEAALDGLVDFHLDFALGEPDLIRIQDRDWAHLPDRAKRQVRAAQRQYVEIWVDQLRERNTISEADARLMAHAAFGLMNSTPHALKAHGTKGIDPARSREVLRAMTVAAFDVAGPAAPALSGDHHRE